LGSFRILRNVKWYFLKDVSRRPVGPFLKGQAVEEECCCAVDENSSSGTSCHIDWYVFAEVSEDFIAFIFRIMQSKEIFYPEDGRQKTVSS